MAAVVRRTTRNRYGTHRVLTPDGTLFVLNETNDTVTGRDGEDSVTGPIQPSNSTVSNRIIDDTYVFVNNDTEFSRRVRSLSNREILSMAVDQIPVDNLTDWQKDALRIYRERLDRLEDLVSRREALGTLYREQMFAKMLPDKSDHVGERICFIFTLL